MAPFPSVLLQRLLEEQQQQQPGLLLHLLKLLSIFFLSILFLGRLSRIWSKKTNLPPSPPKFPFIGNLHQLGDLLHHSLRDLSRKYGPIMLLHFGHSPVLVISSAEMAKEVMKNQDTVFRNRPTLTAAQVLFYKCQSIGFAPYGEYWKQVRKICVTDLLGVKRVQSFMFIREEETDFFIKNISQSCSQQSPINLSDMLLTLTNGILSRCNLGMRPENINGNRRIGKLSREVMHLLGAFCFGDLFPRLRWMDVLTGLTRRLKRTSQEVDALLDSIINEHVIKRENQNQNSQENKQDFVDILLHVQKENKLNVDINKNHIKAIMMDVFIGGTDTTATVIEWAMAELVKNPNTMKKVQAEVRQIVGNTMKVKEEDIQQMEYFKCVIKEALRLHPPGPLLVPRESGTSTQIGGYTIPRKTRVYINAWAIQRDPMKWEKAEEFIPERFSESSVDFKGQDFELVPFGSGRRSCPGMSFGIAVVELALANLLYWFDWELPNGELKEMLDMSESFGFTANKKIALHLLPSHYMA
ncbi:hypothetical protein Syun_030407 [Stephania yunnanensis]|uniref:Cytochrome P450 n=1 Tax=Stephania yunnanensis TaxID=152371 RepID=A0AAP0EEY6_9MAGN